jgi:hypothetical protein
MHHFAKVVSCLAILAVFFILPGSPLGQTLYAQQTKTKPHNPVIDGWYADPEGVIFENKYWIFSHLLGQIQATGFFGCLFFNRHGDLEKAS